MGPFERALTANKLPLAKRDISVRKKLTVTKRKLKSSTQHEGGTYTRRIKLKKIPDPIKSETGEI
jgi:hypothetical protein